MPFSVSSLGTVGPYTVELATAVAGLDVELHSVYLGHPASDTHAVHLELRRDGPPRVTTREHQHASLPVNYAHERLLLDHAARLRDLVADAGGDHTAVELDNNALAPCQPGWQR